MGGRKTEVAIIGAGPAGLLLGHLLRAEGVDAVVIERQSADHVLSRIRAGVLEQVTTGLMERLGLDARLKAEGLLEEGFNLADGPRRGILAAALEQMTEGVAVRTKKRDHDDLLKLMLHKRRQLH